VEPGDQALHRLGNVERAHQLEHVGAASMDRPGDAPVSSRKRAAIVRSVVVPA
jgi:hypothetical protein